MYYGKKIQPDTSRANVDLGLMQGHVHTILAKIDNPLVFKFSKRKQSQLRKVDRLNALRAIDQQSDFWDIKDLVGKKQVTIYGRTIYSYYADSYNGYCPHLDNVDVYDFLIDPAAGGIDIEKARYLGDFGVTFDRQELKDGIKDGIFLKTETENLLAGSSNAGQSSQEQTNKQNRTADQNTWQTTKEITNSDKFKFWRWGTTYEGQRYYLLLSESGASAVRVEAIEEVFESGLWWYWTYAAFPDMTEFWTPGYCDYVRENFMAQSVSVNQSLDNVDQINKPQRVINVDAIEDLSELKFKRDGIIKVKGTFDVEKAIQVLRPPSIDTPLKMFELLQGIAAKTSGVTPGAEGGSDTAGKVGIYEGNQENIADRFGLLNKSYSFGYHRFAILYQHGIKEHLIKKIAIEILGPDGIEEEELINRRDIYAKGDTFGVMVEASNAEIALSKEEKSVKMSFLIANAQNQNQNGKKAYEISAQIAGFDEETIRELMDTSDFGDVAIMAEASRDIERILEGKEVKPNQKANTAYKQKFVDYMRDHEEDMDIEKFKIMSSYVLLLEPVITRNMVRQLSSSLLKTPPLPVDPENPGGGGVMPIPKAGVDTLTK